MRGLGTLINVAAIVLGGLLGRLVGGRLPDRIRDGLTKACGISTIFIAISGALEQMLTVEDGVVTASGSILVVICLALGTLTGELLRIEEGLERFGLWLKQKSGNSSDSGFVDAFVTASLTVCIGAMAIVGSIRDGIQGDWSVLAVKAVLDLIIITVMAGSMGRGCVFSAIPVAVLQGSITLLAGVLAPVMTDAVLRNISITGSVLIFCVGVDLVWGKLLKVANMLPALIFAAVAAYLPALI